MGESFKAEKSWKGIYKARESKNWVLIYESRLTANLIKKSFFGDKLEEFKKLVKTNNIPSMLR